MALVQRVYGSRSVTCTGDARLPVHIKIISLVLATVGLRGVYTSADELARSHSKPLPKKRSFNLHPMTRS